MREVFCLHRFADFLCGYGVFNTAKYPTTKAQSGVRNDKATLFYEVLPCRIPENGPR